MKRIMAITLVGIVLMSMSACSNEKAKAEAKAKAELAEKARIEAKAKAEAEAAQAVEAAKQAEAKAKAEAEAKKIADEKAAADAKKVEEEAKKAAAIKAIDDAMKAKGDEYAKIAAEANAKAAILANLAKLSPEKAATGADKDRLVDLKRKLDDAMATAEKEKAEADAAASKARAAAAAPQDTRKKSEYKGWSYVGDGTVYPMSELSTRDKKRTIKYISGGKDTAGDTENKRLAAVAAEQADQAKKAQAAIASAKQAYDDYAVAYKKRLESELADLKAKGAAINAEYAKLGEQKTAAAK